VWRTMTTTVPRLGRRMGRSWSAGAQAVPMSRFAPIEEWGGAGVCCPASTQWGASLPSQDGSPPPPTSESTYLTFHENFVNCEVHTFGGWAICSNIVTARILDLGFGFAQFLCSKCLFVLDPCFFPLRATYFLRYRRFCGTEFLVRCVLPMRYILSVRYVLSEARGF